jgi:hypothetical protein
MIATLVEKMKGGVMGQKGRGTTGASESVIHEVCVI